MFALHHRAALWLTGTETASRSPSLLAPGCEPPITPRPLSGELWNPRRFPRSYFDPSMARIGRRDLLPLHPGATLFECKLANTPSRPICKQKYLCRISSGAILRKETAARSLRIDASTYRPRLGVETDSSENWSAQGRRGRLGHNSGA